ncbi:hydrolase [Pseudomonas luteola]|uniref:hydrolase n=1 Tax=Pseudomonas TaxID=286 RepID=UPI000F7855D6|nr:MULTISPECIES: hydrolase [Pseudomonas]RRW47965.1 hydrolase [Pseudomonas luteola]
MHPIVEDLSAQADAFRPAWWLPGPHLQTLWGSLWRRLPLMTRPRERIWLDDGDFLDLDWYGPEDPYAPLVLAIHGLTGSSSSHYILGLQLALAEHGWASVGLNWRGCSGEPNLLPRGYHSGVTEDLAAVIAHLQAKRPLAPLYAVGYSLGGNVLLKYLGEAGLNCPLQAAASVSVPFRLDLCADRIAIGFSRVYQAHFMRELVSYVKRKREALQERQQHDHVASLDALGSLEDMKSFWDFDGRITAPLHGFKDAHDYYRQASSRYYLKDVRIPTLMIQAEDDPFIGRESLPTPGELSNTICFERHAHGGHVGFVAGTWRNPDYYLERRIPQWLLWQQKRLT